MIHRANADFWDDYHALPANIRAHADKQFALLKNNPQHPSLQFKKLGDRNGQEIRLAIPFRINAFRYASEPTANPIPWNLDQQRSTSPALVRQLDVVVVTLANISLDMRHVARCGSDDKDNPPQGTETAF